MDRRQIEQHARSIETRIKAAHDHRGCQVWETWQAQEKDQDGRKFLATWTGCRACAVAILQN
jgi:hypothetical protein